jgi:hypothetical protein
MLILFDNGVPAPLRHCLNRASLVNGELLEVAEAEGFELLLTTDKNIRYQQNLTTRQIAFVVLGNSQWPVVRRYVERIVIAVDAATPGS